jgi:hypothetical protein
VLLVGANADSLGLTISDVNRPLHAFFSMWLVSVGGKGGVAGELELLMKF